MTDSKKIAVKILRGFGKGLYLFGKGIWIFTKACGRAIDRATKNYARNQRRKEAERHYYNQIARESHAAECGRQQAIYEFRARDRARRENERQWQQSQRNMEALVFGEPYNRKKKKKSIWSF
jgi:hypothetical protein